MQKVSGWEIDGEIMRRVQLLCFLTLNGTSNIIDFLNNLLLVIVGVHSYMSVAHLCSGNLIGLFQVCAWGCRNLS
jgi:hypothetical protein